MATARPFDSTGKAGEFSLGKKDKHEPKKSSAGTHGGESGQGVLGWEDMLPRHRR